MAFFFLRCRRLIVKVIGVNKTKQPFLDPGKMAASSWVFDIHPYSSWAALVASWLSCRGIHLKSIGTQQQQQQQQQQQTTTSAGVNQLSAAAAKLHSMAISGRYVV